MRDLEENFIAEISMLKDINQAAFLKFQRKFAKENKSDFRHKDKLLKAYQKLIKNGTIKTNASLEKILQMKSVRSQSGIAVVSVLTKPYPCPGKCIYCPTEANIPKSYLSSEPAVMRAIANKFDPYKQVQSRLKALQATGHCIDKISIRIIGGSWTHYLLKYRSWFIKRLYQACNSFKDGINHKTGLKKSQEINETAASRVVELSIETRPDMISNKEIIKLRQLGVTKVELGVQSLNDKILSANLRGNTVSDIKKATELLKNAGFKVSYQMMINLYGSNEKDEIEDFKKLFKNSDFCPDHLKIYPLALVKNSELYKKYLDKQFEPYSEKQLIKILAKLKQLIPIYCRVERVIRDIPSNEIVEGAAGISNLRQEVIRRMALKGKKCKCIRCREVKNGRSKGRIRLIIFNYQASGGQEYFISVEDKESDKLIGFCRLRLSKKALLREIHVYGPTVAINKKEISAFQHKGYGRRMMKEAEKIAKKHGYGDLWVISGVGVRQYFRNMGYALRDTYMVKKIN